MNIVSTVLTFGASPVRVATSQTLCSKILAEPASGNTHTSYAGISTMVKATLVGVISELAAPGPTAIQDRFTDGDQDSANTLDATAYYFDGFLAEKIKVTYWQR